MPLGKGIGDIVVILYAPKNMCYHADNAAQKRMSFTGCVKEVLILSWRYAVS